MTCKVSQFLISLIYTQAKNGFTHIIAVMETPLVPNSIDSDGQVNRSFSMNNEFTNDSTNNDPVPNPEEKKEQEFGG